MKTAVSLLFLLGVLGSSGYAQASTPDLKSVTALFGTWILNTKESSGPRVEKGLSWVIAGSATEIRITRNHIRSGQTRSYDVIVYTDERGEVNLEPVASMPEGYRFSSKTVWKKEKLVRRIPAGQLANYAAAATETYRLSKAGTQLIFEREDAPTSFGIPGDRVPNRLVFDKKKD